MSPARPDPGTGLAGRAAAASAAITLLESAIAGSPDTGERAVIAAALRDAAGSASAVLAAAEVLASAGQRAGLASAAARAVSASTAAGWAWRSMIREHGPVTGTARRGGDARELNAAAAGAVTAAAFLEEGLTAGSSRRRAGSAELAGNIGEYLVRLARACDRLARHCPAESRFLAQAAGALREAAVDVRAREPGLAGTRAAR